MRSRILAPFAALALSGCLPEPEPGIGRQVVPASTIVRAGIAPGANAPRLVAWDLDLGVGSGGGSAFDLRLTSFTFDGGERRSLGQPVAAEYLSAPPRLDVWDALGRVCVPASRIGDSSFEPGVQVSEGLRCVDPASGASEVYGIRGLATLSRSGRIMLVEPANLGGTRRAATAIVLGGPRLTFEADGFIALVGDSVLFRSASTGAIMRWRDGALTPIRLLAAGWKLVDLERESPLIVSMPGVVVDGVVKVDWLLYDAEAGTSVALPFEPDAWSLSPDGQSFALMSATGGGGQAAVAVVDRVRGTVRQSTVTDEERERFFTGSLGVSPDGRAFIVRGSRVWRYAEDDSAPVLLPELAWRGDGAPLAFDSTALLTVDGWDHDRARPVGATRLVDLSSVRPPLELAAAGAFVARWLPLPGKRMLLWLSPSDADRTDLVLVDVTTGTKRVLASRVQRVVLGRERALVVSHAASWPLGGRLDLVGFDGSVRVLAQNVIDFALPRACDTCDPLAPGQPFVYAVRVARGSPFDGLWTATLP